jgi:hypothetical protein
MKRKLFGSAERGVGLLYDKEGIKKWAIVANGKFFAFLLVFDKFRDDFFHGLNIFGEDSFHTG